MRSIVVRYIYWRCGTLCYTVQVNHTHRAVPCNAMANNYCQGATLIKAAHPDKIIKAWGLLQAAVDRAEESDRINYPYDNDEIGGLCIETEGDKVYIGSGDESFNESLFTSFIRTCLLAGWITEPVGIEVCWFCDKLRPDSFGGAYIRVTKDKVLAVSTSLQHLSDDDLEEVQDLINSKA